MGHVNHGAANPLSENCLSLQSTACIDYLDMDPFAPADLDRWSAALVHFFKALTLKSGKRLDCCASKEAFPGEFSCFQFTRRLIFNRTSF